MRCEWCYARNTEYAPADNMDYALAKDIIDLCAELGIRHVVLIGGEPTLYARLFDVIDACRAVGITCGVVTNGIACKNHDFVRNMTAHGVQSISVSLKGEDAAAFRRITGKDAFAEVCAGVANCVAAGLKVGVSMVLTEDNIHTYLAGIEDMKRLGVQSFRLSFCYEFDTQAAHGAYLQTHDPVALVRGFMQQYETLDKLTEHRFTLQNGLPLCLWDAADVARLKRHGQISTVCQLLAKTGLIFDTEGYVIPCNAMPSLRLGRLHADFNTAAQLQAYMASPSIRKVYDRLCGVPDESCLRCDRLVHCGGGCVCQWSDYSFAELMKRKNNA